MGLPNVTIYDDLLDPNRKNAKIDGFDFDVDTFENLISAFTPKDMVPVILGVPRVKLEEFCDKAYGLTYSEAYTRLIGVADFWMRKAIGNLAASGNGSALNIAAKHFMGLKDEEDKKAVTITFVNDLGGNDDQGSGSEGD